MSLLDTKLLQLLHRKLFWDLFASMLSTLSTVPHQLLSSYSDPESKLIRNINNSLALLIREKLTCEYVTGHNFLARNLSIVGLSVRKSNLVPTNTMGVDGQWWCTSGYHLEITLPSDSGLTSEKQIKKTFVSGYESGRSRS